MEREGSLRDVDEDDIENALDTCPVSVDSGVDSDGDGVDDACDPSPFAASSDHDGDVYADRVDNCPVRTMFATATPTPVPNPLLDTENYFNSTDNGPNHDQIGDPCDNGVVASTGVTLGINTPNGKWYLDPIVVAHCLGGLTDADGDGYCASDRDIGFDSGGCAPNCAARHNPWSAGLLLLDSDVDGFGDMQETWMGTGGTARCARTSGPNNDPFPDTWPFDFDDNRIITGPDILKFGAPFGHLVSEPPIVVPSYGTVPVARFDFNQDGIISGPDILKFAPVFGTTCSPPVPYQQ
jgi:hypothetical protein